MISWHFQILNQTLKKIFSMKQIESQYTSIKRKKKNYIHTHIAKKKKKKFKFHKEKHILS